MLNERDLPWLAEPLAALRDGSRGHALILYGGAGSGQLELALRAAQAWLCEQPPGPCDACPSCHLSIAHSHPDLKVVLPETLQIELRWNALDDYGTDGGDGDGKGKRKPSRDIKVEQVRQAIDWAHTSSGRGRGKVLVFHPADAMNTVSANALLKTLEEPAAGMRLILCVDDPERLLPTIRSRCQRVRLAPPEADAALRWLQAAQVEEAATLLRAAGGEPLAARSLRDAGLSAERWSSLPRRIAAGEVSAVSDLPVPLAVHILQQLCHDAMAVGAGALPRYFPEGSIAPPAAWPALTAWREALLRVARHDEHPWNGGLVLEALVAQGQHALSARTGAMGKSVGPGGRRPPVGTLAP